MTKLNEKERQGFEAIIKSDTRAIDAKVKEQIAHIWHKARLIKLKEKGYDEMMRKKAALESDITRMKEEIHQIEETLNSKPLTQQQILELGGEINEYGRGDGADFHGIPITSQFEYEVATYIRQNIDLQAPAKFLQDLARSAFRELAMVGTFEEAKEVYEKVYALDFRKYGVDIPPRLAEIKTQNPTLQAPKEMLQIEGSPDQKLMQPP